MLLHTRNKSIRLSIYCGPATGGVENEFRYCGFRNFQSEGSTFEDFLMAEAAGDHTDVVRPSPRAKTQSSGRERTTSVDACVLPAQCTLKATARLGARGRVFYSEEGTPIRDAETTIEMLRLQLYGKASRDKVETFINALKVSGSAEIREAKPMAQFLTLG